MKIRCAIVCFFLIPLFAKGQQISYLIPDIGTPGMNTYVEIIGPYNQNGNFGSDGVYLNNLGDAVRVICANASDKNKIVIGPVIVSQSGKMISTHMFVLPSLQPNSDNWQSLNQAWRIPIQVIANGNYSNADTFYIVQPQPTIIASSPGAIGSGGALGFRSRRGAMIVDSMILSGSGMYTIDTTDCDPATPGNQGYLPAVIMSKTLITIANGATLGADGNRENGGPGGGGVWNASDPNTSTLGGDGFTGGEGGSLQGGNGSGGAGDIDSCWGGMTLNGMPGGAEKPGALAYYQGQDVYVHAGVQGTGGGCGMPFGTSGQGGWTERCVTDNTFGGFGGGSAAGECCCSPYDAPTAFGGGGGGNATPGTTLTSGGGSANGNAMLVPMAGGSGGAGGNPWETPSGYGGGGGGAISLFGYISANINTEANGSKGGDMTGIDPSGTYSGAGGGGAGGGILGMAKISVTVGTVSATGGAAGIASSSTPNLTTPVQNGGEGGAGRVRFDGPQTSAATIIPAQASQYRGPSTDTSQYVWRTFTLNGTGNGDTIHIYIKPQSNVWQNLATIVNYTNNWSQQITLQGTDTLYFLAVTQQVLNPDTTQYTMEPSYIFSQAAANILRIISSSNIFSYQQQTIPTLLCDTAKFDTVYVHNNGTTPLDITSTTFSKDNQGYSIISPSLIPVVIEPGDSIPFIIQFTSSSPGIFLDTLNLFSNDATPSHNPWKIAFAGKKDISIISASVFLPSVAGRPGDTVYIPIIIQSLQQQIQLNGITYQARVSYNGTILLPIGMLHGTIDTIGNGYVVFTGSNAADTAVLKCIIGLGDSVSTALHIDTVNWGGCVVQSTSIDGTFSLTGLCTQGGTRLYDENGTISLSQNNPNPFIGVTEIDYNTIEDGPTRLWITDMLGRQVAVLADGAYKAGKYAAHFDASGLQPGVYNYILQTPTQLLRKTMMLLK